MLLEQSLERVGAVRADGKEELEQELTHKFPSGRIGQPEDAARLVAFLASDEAAWITGQTIHSEGGFFRS